MRSRISISFSALADFDFLFLLGDFGFGLSHVDCLLLSLLLDFVGRIGDSLLGIRNLLQVGLFHGEVVLLLRNFEFCGDCGVVRILLGLGLRYADIPFGVSLGNGGRFADGRRLVDTEVFDDAVSIFEVLDVERLHHDTELFEVGNGVFEHEFRNLLAVAHEVNELHSTDDFTHVTFENVDNHGADVFGLLVQEVLGRRL